MDVACKGKSTVQREYLSANLCLTPWQSAVNVATVFPPQHGCHILSSTCFWNCLKPSSRGGFRSTGCYNNLVPRSDLCQGVCSSPLLCWVQMLRNFYLRASWSISVARLIQIFHNFSFPEQVPPTFSGQKESTVISCYMFSASSLIHQLIVGRMESIRMDKSEGFTGINSMTGRNRIFLGFQGRVDTL